ncbi:MAG: hypothetical protein SPL00_04915 [Bacilli bacterium]|nr:hypothetical protein [Bacilli bacterium]
MKKIDFKSIFSKAIIVNKKLNYFVIGDGDLTNPPLKPKLMFSSTIEYTIRRTKYNTSFGVVVID